MSVAIDSSARVSISRPWLSTLAAPHQAAVMIAVGFVLWTAIGTFTHPGVPLDMAEMIGWGNQWQWGYHKHPPLPCWIGESIWAATHSTLAVYLFSQLCTVISLVCVYQVARRWLSAGHAVVAVAALQASYYTHYTTLDLNHTITCRLFWSLALLSFVAAIEAETRRGARSQANETGARGLRLSPLVWWSLCGVSLGLGGLSKYYIAVLAACFALVPLVIPQYRVLLKRIGPWCMMGLAGITVGPHVIWLFENEFAPITYALQRGSVSDSSLVDHLVNPLTFLLKQAGVWLVLLGVLRLMLKPSRDLERTVEGASPAVSAAAAVSPSQRRLAHLVILGPIVGFLLASAVSGASLRSMWGGPLWTFFPVWLLMVMRPTVDARIRQRALVTGLAVGLLFAAVSVADNFGSPYVQSRPSRHHAPTQTLAVAVESAWQSHGGGPLPIVAGPFFHACLVNMHHPDRPEVYYDARPELAPWTGDEEMRRRGGVLVWELGNGQPEKASSELPSDWSQRFPEAVVHRPSELAPLTAAPIPTLKYGIAVVPPRSSRRLAETQAERPSSSRR